MESAEQWVLTRRLRRGNGGAFSGSEIADVAPDDQAAQPFVGFIGLTGLAGVHLHAETTLIDL